MLKTLYTIVLIVTWERVIKNCALRANLNTECIPEWRIFSEMAFWIAKLLFKFLFVLRPFDPAKKDGNLSAQIISQEQPVSETAALNPDWVEWLMGFPKGWTDVSSGPSSPKESPA